MNTTHVRERLKNIGLYLVIFLTTLVSMAGNVIFFAGKFEWFLSPTPDLAKAFGNSDQAAYLRVALDLQDFVLEPQNYWVLGLWPPGTPILSSVLDLLPGPLLVYLICTAAAFWAIPAYLLIISNKNSPLTIISTAILWVFNPIFHHWLFGAGFFTSQSIGLPIMAAAISLLLFSLTEKGSKTTLVLAGVFMGVSLYFRATYLPLVLVSILMFLLILGSIWMFGLWKTTGRITQLRLQTKIWMSSSLSSALKGFYAFALPLALVALPWALLVFFVINPGNLSWSANEYLWIQKWTSSENLLAQGGGWLVEGGTNWPCVLDPVYCGAIQAEILEGGREEAATARTEAFRTMASSFGPFLSMRLGNLLEAFPSLPGSPIGLSRGFETSLGYLAFLVMYFAAKASPKGLNFLEKLKLNMVLVLTITLVFANFAILAVYHIETRYFFPAHVVTLLSTGFFATIWLKKKSDHKLQNVSPKI